MVLAVEGTTAATLLMLLHCCSYPCYSSNSMYRYIVLAGQTAPLCAAQVVVKVETDEYKIEREDEGEEHI